MHYLKSLASWIVVGLLVVAVVLTGCSSSDEDDTAVDSADMQRQMIPQKARSYLIRANDALQQGAYHAALSMADSAEAVKENLADAGYIRGRAYTELKQYDKAQKAYEKTLSMDPAYQGIRLNLGNNAFRQGQFRAAIEWYKKERDRYPTGTLWLHLGRAYHQLEKPDSAAHAYRKAINFDTTATESGIRADAHIRLAQVFEDQGKAQEGLVHARRAVEMAPNETSYRYILGSLLYRTGQTSEAVRELKQVVEEDPKHQSAHYRLGQALIRLGREEEAEPYLATSDTLQQINEQISQLRTLAEQNPEQPNRWLRLGQALREAGQFEEAMGAYQVLLSMNPDNVAIQMTLANLALRAGDPAQAAQRYQALLRQDSTVTDAWVNLGVVYATSGRPQQAQSVWERALELDPNNQRVQTYLARLNQGDR